ncbi:dna-directed rna polymerase ii subunit rpb9-like [Lichtheimia corymbifera JMRC:FSU:9682]|uniref:DNA-directed RNA polymerase subunit n=1 Tax=Lichtheimia corymbifera JMRC:FSU:9682 TaxID=1263082 RepID=A0A068S955_9FUNG|nr:dna-directed rna polymerase ii subunit rpb9-like [Lichtheimia corymbifera JMRC:FSU:9682]
MATFKYCLDCNNLLYPREDKEHRKLLFACRNCQYEEDASNLCVYKHEIIHAASEQTTVLSELSVDPTLPRSNIPCPRCGYEESVFFQSTSRRADAKMTLFYVCGNRNCGHRWVG